VNFINFSNLLNIWNKTLPLLQAFIIFALSFFLVNFLIAVMRKKLIEKASTKKQISSIQTFSKVLRYILIGFLVVLAISIASDSLQQFGLTVGILSAAIGFALQKPITGFAAWLMIMVKRPFEIGDRISVGNNNGDEGLKGNVKSITLTHVYLEEVGRYGGEEMSGRTIIISNSKFFEENIINYTYHHKYILGQVIFNITHESELDEATAIAMSVVNKYTGVYNEEVKKEAHFRLYFTTNGMEIHARYYVPVSKAQEISSKITKDIFSAIKHHPAIDLSYQEHNIRSKPATRLWNKK
jgi:small-conductance mechanosensitive channel